MDDQPVKRALAGGSKMLEPPPVPAPHPPTSTGTIRALKPPRTQRRAETRRIVDRIDAAMAGRYHSRSPRTVDPRRSESSGSGRGAQRAGDRRAAAAPEALDLGEAAAPQCGELFVQREVAIFPRPGGEVLAGLGAGDPVLAHAGRPAVEHQRVEPRALCDRGIEVQE